jgi:hypothetical protein
MMQYYDPNIVTDLDTPFTIDPVTREIKCKKLEKKILMQHDHNSERFRFEIPRYMEGRDVGLCNVVQIYYINVDATTREQNTGIYTVDDLNVYPFYNDILTCSWLISSNVTKFAGPLSFMIRFAQLDGDKVKYAWHTKQFEFITVAETIESAEVFEHEYVDIIQQWKDRVMSEMYNYVDISVKNNVNVAQIDVNKNNIADLANDAAVMKARMDAFSKLPEGSTSGDAELADIRVGLNGKRYENAGEAVREQFKLIDDVDSERNPFNMLSFTTRRYYKGSSDIALYTEIGQSSRLIDLASYKSTASTGTDSLRACAASLSKPIPVFSGASEYLLIVDCDVDDYVSVKFSSMYHWGTNATHASTKDTKIKKGVNVIKLDFPGFNDAGHTEYTYCCLQTRNIDSATKYDAYIVNSAFLANYVDDQINELRSKIIFNELDIPVNIYTKSCECTAEYVNSKLHIHIPEKITSEAEWRFVILSFNLGTDISGKKFLVQKHTNSIRSFGLGVHSAQWAAKQFNMNNEIQLVDVDEFIADNPTLANNTGVYYLIIGIELGNPITHNHELNESVSIMEVGDGINSISPIARLAEFNPDSYVQIEDLPKDPTKKIICWGDSLTAQGYWTTKLASLSGFEVINCGTGGENSNTIMSRQGADCIEINNVTIPAAVSAVKLTDYDTKFSTYFGKTVSPLLQGGTAHVNPCMLGDIEGTLKWTGSAYNDASGVWTFTRSVAGSAVTINRPTQLITFADREYNDGRNIHIFFIGTNDGAFNVDEMIEKLRLMIDHSKTCEYLIMGLTRIQSEGYKEKFKAAFGRKWLDLHGYLVNYGLADAGLTATAEDNTAISNNLVPPSLLMDAVHYTEKTRELVGIQVYNRMRDLHYFD